MLDDFSAKKQNNILLKLGTRKPNHSIVHTTVSFISSQKRTSSYKLLVYKLHINSLSLKTEDCEHTHIHMQKTLKKTHDFQDLGMASTETHDVCEHS